MYWKGHDVERNRVDQERGRHGQDHHSNSIDSELLHNEILVDDRIDEYGELIPEQFDKFDRRFHW